MEAGGVTAGSTFGYIRKDTAPGSLRTYADSAGSSHTHTITGDDETRPKTAPVVYIIALYNNNANVISTKNLNVSGDATVSGDVSATNLTLSGNITGGEASAVQAGTVKLPKTQTKVMVGQNDTTQVSFSNLIVGNLYTYDYAFGIAAGGEGAFGIQIVNGTDGLTYHPMSVNTLHSAGSITFIATATTLDVNKVSWGVATINPTDSSGSYRRSWATLTDHQVQITETTDFT